MGTRTGRRFWPLDPRIEELSIFEIGHALSNICRFTGHTAFHYSVAQHSVICCEVARIYDSTLSTDEVRHLQLALLFHDGSEAYYGDINRPLRKQDCMEELRAMDTLTQTLINEMVGLPLDAHIEPLVIKIDNHMLATEATQLLESTEGWNLLERPLPIKLPKWLPETAREYWMTAYEVLRNGRLYRLPAGALS